jgi:signal transduction histidine kinase/CheY-like chemotaxis protein
MYTFRVKAIDRDLNHSEPASVILQVVLPWYLNGWIAFPSGTAILALLVGVIWFGRRYYAQRRESQRLREQVLQQERGARETLEAKNTQLEEAKEAAEIANQAKSIFLANVNHEIRTPVSNIIGYTNALLQSRNLQSDHRADIQIVANNGNKLLRLIDEVLDLSRIEAGRIELQNGDFDLMALVNDMSMTFQARCEEKVLSWKIVFNQRNPGDERNEDNRFENLRSMWVHGDEPKLRHVLRNLLSNAVKFTDAGEIVLRIFESMAQSASGTHFTFEVIDTGAGIAVEDYTKIFEPFQQGEAGKQRGGTGLGLSTSRKRVELMGGHIEVESEVGVGTRFFFTIPLTLVIRDVVGEVADVGSTVVRLAEGYSVSALVVDDVQENRDLLYRYLTEIGCDVLMAENGPQAVSMFRHHRPEVVFMDIRMPSGEEGIEAAQEIWAEFGRDTSKIVAISASALAHEQQGYLEAGFDAFVPKPFQPQQIYDCLANLLGVEYEYEASEDQTTDLGNLPRAVLPPELLSHLQQAAEDSSITDLSELINQVDKLGPDAQLFAGRLRDLANQYDFDGVLDILGAIHHEGQTH